MLHTIISEFVVAKYRVLMLDKEPPLTAYRSYLIEDTIYTPVSIYDMPKCIAIDDSGKSFVGQTVDFVSDDSISLSQGSAYEELMPAS